MNVNRIFAGLASFLAVVLSVAFWFIGIMMAMVNYYKNSNPQVWYFAIGAMIVATIFAIVKARKWLVITTIGSVIVGFSSCTANFHWFGT